MSRQPHLAVALALTVLAGMAIILTTGYLTVDVYAARHDAEVSRQRTDQLIEQLRSDAAYADPLHAEYDRATDASLDRAQTRRRLANALLAAVALFIVAGKRLVSLRAPHAPRAPKYVQMRMAFREAVLTDPAAGGSPPTAAPRAVADVDPVSVDAIIARIGRDPAACIPILHALQDEHRYLPEAALRRVCEQTAITPAQLAGVASFYARFRRTPVGEHVIRVCHGTACHVAGAPRITAELRRRLGIGAGEDTDPAGRFTVDSVPCLGCCTLAPVAQRDEATYGHLRTDTLDELLRSEMEGVTPVARTGLTGEADEELEIRVGMGSCCVANGSKRVEHALHDALARSGVRARVKQVGCVGMCHQTPLVEVRRNGQSCTQYARVVPDHAESIVREHGSATKLARRLRNTWEELIQGARQRLRHEHALDRDHPHVAAFLDPQRHIATEHCGCLSPIDLDEYLAHGGFRALERCRGELAPAEVIAQVRASGLRGRGGAGFPTADKWARVREAEGARKYIICNGDEGDPGAFMDRMLMESYPYRIIEGVAIAAHAVGATDGFFYIRSEYPLAVERIEEALRRCEARGLLGENARGAGQGLRLQVMQGAGAFVCGEETALIASLEGRRGMPALRPPYPAERGLWNCPTLVNNVETFAVLPWIFRHGPSAFSAYGTANSKGTKVFALAGKVARGGLIEVPMGTTIRSIVEDIGGGVKDGRTFKAVQIGGPSGGCIPAALADTPVDYEALQQVGAIMGSGGLVVLDDTDCMVDMARYFLAFTQDQSCGKCTPCRVGTRRMLEILERLCAGRGVPADLDALESLAHVIAQGSLCGLGATAPNPVLTTLRYFREEYTAHLAGRCPAGRCKDLITYSITESCTGCTLCAQHCPVGAIPLRPYERHTIDAERCTRCDICRVKCPEQAVRVA